MDNEMTEAEFMAKVQEAKVEQRKRLEAESKARAAKVLAKREANKRACSS